MKLSKEEIKVGRNKAYKEAGNKAYFGDGFQAGIDFMLAKGFHYTKKEMNKAFEQGSSAAEEEFN